MDHVDHTYTRYLRGEATTHKRRQQLRVSTNEQPCKPVASQLILSHAISHVATTVIFYGKLQLVCVIIAFCYGCFHRYSFISERTLKKVRHVVVDCWVPVLYSVVSWAVFKNISDFFTIFPLNFIKKKRIHRMGTFLLHNNTY